MTDQIPDQTTDRPAAQPTAESQTGSYRVLARRSRPARFADLIGQEALVRTLTNAIHRGRLAHAFILTGVRGVGKTTTARIIARALNCIGPDGTGGPTPDPCGVCDNCVAIAQDRHVDVLEMDAASRTGIDDIRELIESVRYRPVQARTKVYIIDEVHMLSKQAFNGLLKTLEEPPEHVVFIFATTEVRKVPVTVLSRCQRFDLRRVDRDRLIRHFAELAKAEGVEISEPALGMIARAADGSVRDGLSLLDQAIALSGSARIDEAQIAAMLGLADRAKVFDLLDAVMRGKAPEALVTLGDLHAAGADPLVVLQDLLEQVHFLTRVKLVPETLEDPGLPETERLRGRDMADKLSLPVLARAWQMLLKGLDEARIAPAGLQATEMVLIRLICASDLPSPADLVKRLRDQDQAARTPVAADPGAGAQGKSRAGAAPEKPGSDAVAESGPRAALAPLNAPEPRVEAAAPESRGESRGESRSQTADTSEAPRSFQDVVALVRACGKKILANHLSADVHLVRFEPGRIELRPGDQAPRNLAGKLGELLQERTGQRWVVSMSRDSGDPTLREQDREREARLDEAAKQHPLVQAAMETFPGAQIVARRDSRNPEPAAVDGENASKGDQDP